MRVEKREFARECQTKLKFIFPACSTNVYVAISCILTASSVPRQLETNILDSDVDQRSSRAFQQQQQIQDYFEGETRIVEVRNIGLSRDAQADLDFQKRWYVDCLSFW